MTIVTIAGRYLYNTTGEQLKGKWALAMKGDSEESVAQVAEALSASASTQGSPNADRIAHLPQTLRQCTCIKRASLRGALFSSMLHMQHQLRRHTGV